jgi:riboflavin kinase/FMN adenylyltransferase
MRRWSSVDTLASTPLEAVVSVGNFDGVHLGHQAIFQKLVNRAKELAVPSVAITFDPHPAVVLGRSAPPLLTTPMLRGDLIEPLGVDHFVVHPFDSEVASLAAEDFVEQYLVRKLRTRCLCIGPNTHVGRGREGTPSRLKELAGQFGFSVDVAPFVEVDGLEVSSSRIRQKILSGGVDQAARLLGRAFRTVGCVVRGEGRGRTIGFPTANLGEVVTVLPMDGVYATTVFVDGRSYPAATNVGRRPTFQSKTGRVVEMHLLSFSGDLMGKTILVDWISRIRDEKTFASPLDLKAQIQADVETVTRILT